MQADPARGGHLSRVAVERWVGCRRPTERITYDLRAGDVEVRVRWGAIMRRIRWAAKRADLRMPRRIKIRPYRRAKPGDAVSSAGWCMLRKGGLFEIGIRVDAPWLIQVEEVLVHEVAHAICWQSCRADSSGHTVTWGAAYGALYAAYYDLDETEGPRRPGFDVRRQK